MLPSMSAYSGSASASASAPAEQASGGAATHLDHSIQDFPLRYGDFGLYNLLDLLGRLMVV
jgi:hypothetical protein